MKILGIETTCDETGVSIVEVNDQNGSLIAILSNIIASQEDLHALYGGVYPELACRRHFDILIPLIDQALKEAQISFQEIDLISVAYGPGLIGALLMGLNCAKALSLAWSKPFIGVNHVQAHLYAALMGNAEPIFPSLGVVVSGGHTFLIKMESIHDYELIGQTVDDAIGEAFDKVAVMLGLPYPGGPQIEKLALKGNLSLYPFKAGVVKQNPWDFSFSGLKTNVLYRLKGKNTSKNSQTQLDSSQWPHIAASFQETALNDVVSKSMRAAHHFQCKAIYLGGGVTQNQRFRDLLKNSPIPVYWPLKGLSLDNAAMIAGLGYPIFLQKGKQSDPLDLEPLARIPLR